GDLALALEGLDLGHYPNLIVGLETADDAGVYKLTDELALVQTVDYFTPIVDDPFAYGQIAAANALSDIYAMGANPVLAMNIVCFPTGKIDLEVLRQILRGGLDKLREAGVALAGGHTVTDPELKYGLAVNGLVHPDRVLTNRGARPGDRLLLTKPLGTGIVNTAIKGGVASTEAIAEVIGSMSALNRDAAAIVTAHPVSACTDVTGFGLAGHAREMIDGEGVGLSIDASSLPFFEPAREYAGMGLLPGGLHRNRKHFAPHVEVAEGVPQHLADLLFDPQTSGGLLVTLPSERAGAALDELLDKGLRAAVIGDVIDDPKERVALR
ncbi:MAG: selenide, water dikinase SelD, partial [Deltaproteobacteria bacterium]|nr:selenide, water dikinase SelD [Deltaproteobacteria bacterium]